MEPTQSQPKSHWLIVTLSVVGIILLVTTVFLYLQNQKLQKKVIDQQVVSTIQTPSSTPETESLTSSPLDEMEGWKTYMNEKYQYQISYPDETKVESAMLQGEQGLETSPSVMLLPNSNSLDTEDPQLVIQVLSKSLRNYNSLMDVAEEYYRGDDKFNDKSRIVINQPTKSKFREKESVEYIINTNIVSSLYGTGIVKKDNYKFIWIEGPNDYYLIYLSDIPIFNQILLTFKFL